MNHSTMRRGHVLLLAVVTILVAFAGSAAATRVIAGEGSQTRAGALQHVTQPVTVPPLRLATSTASCPDGSRAVAGGVSSEGGQFSRVDSSAATNDGSGWRVELLNQHPNQPVTAHVWVACIAIR